VDFEEVQRSRQVGAGYREYEGFQTSMMIPIREKNKRGGKIVINGTLEDESDWGFRTKKNLGKGVPRDLQNVQS